MRLLNSIFRTVAMAGAVLCLTSIAQANSLIPTLVGGAPVAGAGLGGSYRWNYTVNLSADSMVQPGGLDFLTIYDWRHIVQVHSNNDLVWAPTIQALGFTAINTNPTDSAFVNNITFHYLGASTITGPTTPIFSFFIDSTIGQVGLVSYTGQDHSTDSLLGLQGNIGQVRGAAVPEPAFFQLSALIGLGGLGLLKLRRKKV
jgi:hypothetical protein